jgi:hypothetical protein
MATRYVIETALVFDSSEPQFLLIEYGEERFGRCVGEFHELRDAFRYAHERANQRPQLTVIEGMKRKPATEP